jgi:hypothetical protein
MQARSAEADTQGMPGTLHQGLLEIFEQDPWLAFDILGLRRPADGTPIDRRGEIEREGEKPGKRRQGYPDLVMVRRDPRKRRRGAVITVEAQKDYKAIKRWMLPVYQSHLAEKHRLECWAVVVSLSKQFSRAIRRWRDSGPPRVDAMLIDVDTVPKSPWLDDPARRPLAAVLVGALHGYAGDFDAARRAFHFSRTLPKRYRRRHGMTILAALPKAQREQLIRELPMREQHDWMDVERRSGTYQFGREEGRAEGLEQGLEQARSTLIELVFELLAERGIRADKKRAERIRRCEDLGALRAWIKRAVHATSLDDLFEGA